MRCVARETNKTAGEPGVVAKAEELKEEAMFWKIRLEKDADGTEEAPVTWDGRFVLHRHYDSEGPHLDLRLEQEGYLVGWRVDGVTLDGDRWATEKGPHPVQWLEQDGDAVREDAGAYAWLERGPEGGVLVLQGQGGAVRRLEVRRESGLPGAVVGAIREVLEAHRVEPQEAAELIADGVAARQRAIGRFCGLGRELDGSAFDEPVWRKTLAGLTLDEIHTQLRAYEVRFDRKYPPQRVSRPERLPSAADEERTGAARAIVRDG